MTSPSLFFGTLDRTTTLVAKRCTRCASQNGDYQSISTCPAASSTVPLPAKTRPSPFTTAPSTGLPRRAGRPAQGALYAESAGGAFHGAQHAVAEQRGRVLGAQGICAVCMTSRVSSWLSIHKSIRWAVGWWGTRRRRRAGLSGLMSRFVMCLRWRMLGVVFLRETTAACPRLGRPPKYRALGKRTGFHRRKGKIWSAQEPERVRTFMEQFNRVASRLPTYIYIWLTDESVGSCVFGTQKSNKPGSRVARNRGTTTDIPWRQKVQRDV